MRSQKIVLMLFCSVVVVVDVVVAVAVVVPKVEFGWVGWWDGWWWCAKSFSCQTQLS